MNIMLVCNGGVSTNMIVKKMKEAAQQKSEEHVIWAIASDQVKKNVQEKHPDVILLGPQIAYLKDKVKEDAQDPNIKIAVIGFSDYGMCNGAAVLETA